MIPGESPTALAYWRLTDKKTMERNHTRQSWRPLAIAAALVTVLSAFGCAHSPDPRNTPSIVAHSAESDSLGLSAARVARSMVGTEYRHGGSTPSGFDCSGLVVYSFERAGRPGLPHSVARLDDLTRSVRVEAIEVGDLLFFRLQGRKKSHVGIYIGNRRFVHAPSSGKTVEIVSFDHVYWGPRIELAGRLRE
jgi:cell wall-associated NlpC family hydrolase